MDTTQRLVSAFKQQKCWMITPLAEQINYSIPSARRFLAKIGYYSSFTHNGRWYTLASIPCFNQDGLWFHQKIGFSREGSLTRTLIRLTEKSPMGLTAEQIGEILQCRCHAVLVKLYREGRLQRQKQGRSYVYLAADAQIASIQRLALPKAHIPRLPAEMAVLVLVEFIRTPEAEIQQLAKTISRRTGVLIKHEQIQMLFEQHGLKKKA
ncbi:MAG: hypothetical protein GY799_29345 [Desulfobulbaceae bacterium]|nr:hypothetical protein [Desulfobulbaceae bacterium]